MRLSALDMFNNQIGKSSRIICYVSDPQKSHGQVHGCQEPASVCQHIARSLHTGIPVGFPWSSQQTDIRPDAWCSACEQARIDAGGGWTPEVEQQLSVKLLCGTRLRVRENHLVQWAQDYAVSNGESVSGTPGEKFDCFLEGGSQYIPEVMKIS